MPVHCRRSSRSLKREVSFIIELINSQERGHLLHIKLNGSPYKEGKYRLRGKSEHWQGSVEYLLRKDGVFVEGDISYTADQPPKEVDYNFLVYEIKTNTNSNTDRTTQSKMHEIQGRQVEGSTFSISSQSKREYDLEVYKAGISQGYVEIHWKEKDEIKSERISFEIID